MTKALATIDRVPNRVYQADALTLLASLPAGSVDLLLTDPPYGVTAAEWDTAPDLPALWSAIKRVMTPRGAVVMTATEPFASHVRLAALDWFKYDWVWIKNKPSDFIRANLKPMNAHEMILVFSPGTVANRSQRLMTYIPQMRSGKAYKKTVRRAPKGKGVIGARPSHADFVGYERVNNGTRYPTTVLKFSKSNLDNLHLSQKPVALFSYLIKTYTRPGALVVDPYCGSGTTAVAAVATGRRYIVGDISAEYAQMTRDRLAQGVQLEMFG